MIRYYWRLIVTGVCAGERERLELSELDSVSELAAFRRIDQWNRQSAAYCGGRFLYWLAND